MYVWNLSNDVAVIISSEGVFVRNASTVFLRNSFTDVSVRTALKHVSDRNGFNEDAVKIAFKDVE
jgi:hypothetical protein